MYSKKTITLAPLSNDTWAILGILRFALATIVVNSHLGILGSERSTASSFVNSLGTFAAVASFVIISGFSIANSWNYEQDYFLLRRFARIYPLLIVTIVSYLLVIAMLSEVTLPSGFEIRVDQNFILTSIASVLLMNGILVGQIYGPCWSLTAEFWYYLSTPLFSRLNIKIINVILLFFAGIYYLLGNHYGVPLPNTKYGIAILALAWFWIAGYALRITTATNLSYFQVIIVFLLCFFIFPVYNYEGGSLSMLTLITTVMLITFAPKCKIPLKAQRLLNYFGNLSYPLFILHYGVVIICAGLNLDDYLTCFVISIVLSALSLRYIDRPARNRILRYKLSNSERNLIKISFSIYFILTLTVWLLIFIERIRDVF